jgi:integrase
MARHGDAIYERGDTWWLDFVHEGQRHVHKLGKSINRTAARQLAQVKRGAILKGEVGIGPGPAGTVKDYSMRWLKEVAPNLRPKTRKQYRQVLDLYVLPTLGATKLRALDRAAVKALLNARSAQGLSKGTVRLVRATLSVMLGDAVEAELLKFNPAQGLTRRGRKGPGTGATQSERQKKIRPLTPEQLDAFLEAARPRRDEWTLFLTLADAGLRPNEGLALRWEDFDATARQLHIERGLSDGELTTGKTGAERDVDLTPRLAEALESWQATGEAEALVAGREPSPWIFPGPEDAPLDILKVARRFRRLLHRAKVSRFRLYDLRHTYATHLLAMGAPLTYVSAQLGHAKVTTTLNFYAHWLPTVADQVWAGRLERSRTAFPNAIHNTAERVSLRVAVSERSH